MKQIEYNIPIFEDEDKADLKNYSEKMGEAIKTQVDKFGQPLKFMGTVETLAELQETTNNDNGYIYCVKEENKNYIWNGTQWEIYSDNFDINIILDNIEKYDDTEIRGLIANKVDKVSGKGLSTNDFTSGYKTKLDGIATGANKTTVENVLTSTSGTNALSAAQGKVLNYKIVSLQKILYENASGSKTQITLNETSANFDYLYISLKAQDTEKTIRIDKPNGKVFFETLQYASGNNHVEAFSRFGINANIINPVVANCGYKTIGYLNSAIAMHLDSTNYIVITRVVGGKILK